MIVTLIEKVYSFLWGDLVQIPLPGGSTRGISLWLYYWFLQEFILRFGHVFCRFACSRIWCRHWLRRNKKKQSVFISGTDRFDGNPCRYGKSGRCCRGDFRQAAPVRFSGCGWRQLSVRRQLLLKRRWHSYTKKKTHCTVVTAAVRRIIFMHM